MQSLPIHTTVPSYKMIVQGIFIGFISTLLTYFINVLAQHAKLSPISPEMMIGFDILRIRKNIKLCKKIGFLFLLILGIISGLIFSYLYKIILLDPYLLGLIYAVTIWLATMFLVLPIVGRGFLGLKFHNQVPYASLALLGIYGFLLGFLTNL